MSDARLFDPPLDYSPGSESESARKKMAGVRLSVVVHLRLGFYGMFDAGREAGDSGRRL